MKFIIYKTKKGYHWKAVARNGKVQALGGEPFPTMYNAQRAVQAFYKAVYNKEDLEIVSEVKKKKSGNKS